VILGFDARSYARTAHLLGASLWATKRRGCCGPQLDLMALPLPSGICRPEPVRIGYDRSRSRQRTPRQHKRFGCFPQRSVALGIDLCDSRGRRFKSCPRYKVKPQVKLRPRSGALSLSHSVQSARFASQMLPRRRTQSSVRHSAVGMDRDALGRGGRDWSALRLVVRPRTQR
jgi:hypothetical protein